jgi:hypothetical protein
VARRESDQQTIMGFAFKAKKPKRGAHFVCLKRRRFYGTVRTIRPDRTFKYVGPYGLVMDSRREGMTWETVQYDKKGEFRFVEELPEGFPRR